VVTFLCQKSPIVPLTTIKADEPINTKNKLTIAQYLIGFFDLQHTDLVSLYLIFLFFIPSNTIQVSQQANVPKINAITMNRRYSILYLYNVEVRDADCGAG